jgi:hypothetical protein
MSTPHSGSPRKRLPVNPSLENLKKQAKRLANARPDLSLQQAQHALAVEYGCTNWAELSHVVETMSRGSTLATTGKSSMEPLPAAANRSDADTVRQILKDGPFTQHDLDLALARVVLRFNQRREIAHLLIDAGADPGGQYGSNYGPIVFVTGECLDPDGLQFLIDHGADVTFPPVTTKYGNACPMSYALGAYLRGENDRKHRCIQILLTHGAIVPPEVTPPMLAIHQGNAKALAEMIDRDASLLSKQFPTMPYGNIDLRGATLLHLAVEFGEIECLDLLLNRGANINQPALVLDGLGGQTPIFHTTAINLGAGVKVLEHLIHRGDQRIDLSVRATFRLYGEPQLSLLTPLEYAQRAAVSEDPDSREAGQRVIALLNSLKG